MNALSRYLFNPYLHLAGFFVFAAMLAMLGIDSPTANKVWELFAMIYLGFITVNSGFVLISRNKKNYILNSVIASLIYIIATAGLIFTISPFLDIKGNNQSAILFLVFLYHPLLFLVILFAQKVFFMIVRKK